jgi:hypothetical protein
MAVWILRSVWTFTALCGLAFNCALLFRSINDYKIVLKGGKNGLRRYAAITSVLVFVATAATQLSFTVIGIVALTQTPVPSDVPATIQQYITFSVFVTMAVFTAIISGIIFFRRRKLVDMIFEDEDGKESVV